MKTKIKNLEELKWEIARLTELTREQEAYLGDQYILLKDKVEKPIRVLNNVTSSIPGVGLVKDLFFRDPKSATKGDSNAATTGTDWLNSAVRVGVPLLLNKTLLRKSNWIKKSLILLASETAAGQVTQEKVTNAIAKVASFIRPKKEKKKHKNIEPLVDETIQEEERKLQADVKNARIISAESPEDQILGI